MWDPKQKPWWQWALCYIHALLNHSPCTPTVDICCCAPHTSTTEPSNYRASTKVHAFSMVWIWLYIHVHGVGHQEDASYNYININEVGGFEGQRTVHGIYMENLNLMHCASLHTLQPERYKYNVNSNWHELNNRCIKLFKILLLLCCHHALYVCIYIHDCSQWMMINEMWLLNCIHLIYNYSLGMHHMQIYYTTCTTHYAMHTLYRVMLTLCTRHYMYILWCSKLHVTWATWAACFSFCIYVYYMQSHSQLQKTNVTILLYKSADPYKVWGLHPLRVILQEP